MTILRGSWHPTTWWCGAPGTSSTPRCPTTRTHDHSYSYLNIILGNNKLVVRRFQNHLPQLLLRAPDDVTVGQRNQKFHQVWFLKLPMGDLRKLLLIMSRCLSGTRPTPPSLLPAWPTGSWLTSHSIFIDNHLLLLFHYYHLFFPILHLHPQVLWDLSPHLNGLEKGACTWDHRYLICFWIKLKITLEKDLMRWK